LDVITEDVRLCDTCRVVVTQDPESGRWAHPLPFREKFSDHVCDDPQPGRPAQRAEAEWGRGRSFTRDRLSVFAEIPELAQDPHTPLTVGVDGSYKLVTGAGLVRKPMSWAFLTTGGRYGFGTSTIPGRIVGGDRALQGELRAIWWALVKTPDTHPLKFIIDSMDAIELLADWKKGGEQMPRGYTLARSSGREATLLQLAHRVRDAGDRIETEWVRSHTGHPMNEGADALAKMARAWATGRLLKEQVVVDARRAVIGALGRYAAQL
jgi:ribonuclease HI